MRYLAIRAVKCIALLSVVAVFTAHGQITADYVEHQVIVKLKPEAANGELGSLRSSLNATVLSRLSLIGAELWELPQVAVEDALAQYRDDPRIEYIEPNYRLSLIGSGNAVLPNDPRFSELWGLHNTGQSGGTPDADIDAPEAWEIETGEEVVIGVIDTGVDWTHPDLANNIWTNAGETINGIDDDGNGYIDDVRGWDFVNNDNNPLDDHAHGTHVSGTIAAAGNNSLGVVGVCWKARIMPLKFLDAGGFGTTANAILAVEYATKMGARLTNNSWGGGGYSQPLYDAIAAAGNAGVLFIAAAGNDGMDNDVFPHYPSSYNLANIIAVAATDRNDQLGFCSFSNWGANSVDLGAPGDEILSTTPSNSYSVFCGTSMATPHVAGVAGLVWSVAPGLAHTKVKEIIMSSVDPVPALAGQVVSGGRLNAYNAIILADPDSIPPAPVTDLAVDMLGSSSITLNWTATADDGDTSGSAAAYDIRFATSPITAGNFDSAVAASNPPFPNSPGSAEIHKVSGLDFTTTYYFALKVIDEQGNQSDISNVISATTLGIPTIAVAPDSLVDSLYTGGKSTQHVTIGNTGEGTLDFVIPTFGGNASVRVVSAGQERLRLQVVPPDNLKPQRDSHFPRQLVTDAKPPRGQANSLPLLQRLLSDSSAQKIVFFDDMENGMNGWTTQLYDGAPDNLWHQTMRAFNSPTHSWWCGIESLGTYQTTARINTAAISPAIDLTKVEAPITLVFFESYETEFGWDFCMVDVSTNGGVSWTPLRGGAGFAPSGSSGGWIMTSLDISSFAGETIQIRFYFDTRDQLGNDFPGWFFDDVMVTAAGAPWLTVEPAEGTVVAGSSMDVNVHFDATDLVGDDYEAEIVILSNDPITPSVPVTARLHVINAPAVAVSQDTLDFRTVFIGATAVDSLVVTNIGTDSLFIDSITVDHPEYAVANLPFALAPGGSKIVPVNFSPLTVGDAIGELTIVSNDPDDPTRVVRLIGKGALPPDISVSPASLRDSLLTGQIAAHVLTISNELGFSDLIFKVSVAPKAAYIYDNSLSAGGFWVTDTVGLKWLSISPTSGVVQAGDSLELEVSFDAAGLRGGLYRAEITIASNDPDENVILVPVELVVTGAPDIHVATDTLKFGEVFSGVTDTLTLLVENTGTLDLIIFSASTSPSSIFTVSPKLASVDPNERKFFTVTFAPDSAGDFQGLLTLVHNDPDEDTVRVVITGTGLIPPQLVYTPDSLAVSLFTGEISSQTLTIANASVGGENLDFNLEVDDEDLEAVMGVVDPARQEQLRHLAQRATSGIRLVTEISDGSENHQTIDPRDLQRFRQQTLPYAELVHDAGAQSGISAIGVAGFRSPTTLLRLLSDPELTGQFTFTEVGDNYDSADILRFDGLIVDENDFGITAIEAQALRQYHDNGNPILLGMDDLDEVVSQVQSELFPVFGISAAFDRTFFFGSLNNRNPITAGVTTMGSLGSDNDYYTLNGADWIFADGSNDKFGVSYVARAPAVLFGESLLFVWDNHVEHQRLIKNAIVWMMQGSGKFVTVAPDSGSVAAGESVDVTVTFDAGSRKGGEYRANLVINSNDPQNPRAQVPVTMSVTGAARIFTANDTLDFGQVFVNSPDTVVCVLENRGTEDLLITAITASPAEFSAFPQAIGIDAGETDSLYVIFGSGVKGSFQGMLTLGSNDPVTPVVEIILLAQGVELPVVDISPTSISDTLEAGNMSTQVLAIRNANANGADLEFEISVEAKDDSLNSLLSKALRLEPKHSYVGHAQEMIAEQAAHSTGLLTDQESRAGLPPSAAAAVPMELPFHDGFEDGDFTDWIDDGGAGTKIVTDVTAARGKYSFHYANASTGHDHGIHQEFVAGSQPTYVSFYVRAGAANSAQAYFVLSDFAANYVIFFFASDNGFFYVNGDIGGHQTYPYTLMQWYHIEFREIDWSAKNFDYYVDDQLVKADISFRNATFVNDIGFLHLYNFHTGSLAWWDEINVGDPSLSWLSVEPSIGSVPADSILGVAVGFDASNLVAGQYNAELVVSSNDAVTPEVRVPIHLRVTGHPEIVVSDSLVDFDTMFVGVTARDSITVSNKGTDTLKVSNIASGHTDFTAAPVEFALAPDESQTVILAFTPSTAGTVTTLLTIASNDSAKPSLPVALQGIGVIPPKFEVAPNSFTFDVVSGDSAKSVLTIFNLAASGAADLTWQLREAADTALPRVHRQPQWSNRGQAFDSADPPSTSDDRPTLPTIDAVGDIVRSIPFPAATTVINGLAWDNKNKTLWASDFSRALILQLNDETGAIISSFPCPGFGPSELAHDGTNLWYQDTGTGLIYKINPATGAVLSSFPDPIGINEGLTYDGTYLWRGSSSTLIRFDSQGNVITMLPGPGLSCDGLAWDGSTLWFNATGAAGGAVLQIDPQSGDVLQSFIGPSSQGNGLAFDGLYLRYDDSAALAIYSIDIEFDKCPWLTESPVSGTVAANDSQNVQLSVNTAGLELGTNTCTLELTSNDPEVPVVIVPVTLNVIKEELRLAISDSLTGVPGDTVAVPIYLSFNDTTQSVARLEASITVLSDTTDFLSFLAYVPGPIVPGAQLSVIEVPPDSTRLTFADSGNGPLAQDGELVTLLYEISPTAVDGQMAKLELSDLSAEDSDGNRISIVGQGGQMTVKSIVVIAGKVQYCSPAGGGNAARPVPELTATLLQGGTAVQSAQTDASGQYRLANLPPGKDYRLEVGRETGGLGSAISPNDALLAFNIFLGDSTAKGCKKLAADVNGDSTNSPADALLIFNRYLGSIDGFPIADWRTYPANYDIDATPAAWTTAPDAIDYPNLSNDLADQDFYAVVKGDVDLSWTGATGLTKAVAGGGNGTQPAASKLQLALTSSEITPVSEQLVFRLHLNGEALARGVYALGGELQYDPTFMEITSVRWGEQISSKSFHAGHHLLLQTGESRQESLNGRLRFGAYSISTANIRSSDLLIEVNAKPLVELSPGATIPLVLTEVTVSLGNPAALAADLAKHGSASAAGFEEVAIAATAGALVISELPSEFALDPNYPNPFNPTTKIRYQLPEAATVSMQIFNSLGQVVRVLVDDESKPAGFYKIEWNGRMESGAAVASGVYFYVLKAQSATTEFKKIRKMMLVK